MAGSVSAAYAAPNCTYERAHYQLMGSPGVNASFQKRSHVKQFMGDLYFLVRTSSGRVLWFVPEEGNGYTDISLIPASSPEASQKTPVLAKGPDETYFGINTDLSFRTDFPVSGKPAPEYIFVPELGPHIWYSWTDGHQRDAVPRALFKLVDCGKR
jgi:hypothetical protein